MNIFSLNNNKIKNNASKNNYPYNLFTNIRRNKYSNFPSSKVGTFKSSKSNNKSKIIKDNIEINESVKTNDNNSYLKNIKYSFTFLVQYAREKIKKQYTTPYILKLLNSKNFKFIKEEEKPIQFCLFKVNDIFTRKKTRFFENFLECNIFYSENEYLIRSFKRYEYFTIMKYLLAFVYDKNFSAHYNKYEFQHKTNLVKNRFQYLVNNNYRMKEPNEEENLTSERYGQISSSSNRNYIFGKSITPYILKKKNLIYLIEYEKSNNSKIRENYFIIKPNYYLIKDMPLDKVPNPVPKYFSLGFFMYFTIKNFAIKNKFLVYEIKKPENLSKKKIFFNEEDSFEEMEKKKKKKKDTDDEISSDLSRLSSHSERFLEEVYKDSSDEENGGIFQRLITSKINRRVSIIVTKNNKIKQINVADNDIIDVEKLIKNIDNKKEEVKVTEKQLSTTSNHTRKKSKRKSRLKTKIKGFQMVNTDNFQINKLYDENSNYIQRTFSKKLNLFLLNKNIKGHNNYLFGNLNFDKNNKMIIKSPEIIRSNKYFLTSTILRKNNCDTKFSNIVRKKNLYSSKKLDTKRFHFSSKENNKTFVSLDKLNKNKNINNKKNIYTSNIYNKNIIYVHHFKNQGKIIKQRKISFSIIHNSQKIEFKDTSEFITGIKKSFTKKKHQKELIKEIISNFGNANSKKNKYGNNDNKNFPPLSQYRVKTATNTRKYKINISGHSSKNYQQLNQKEIFRDCINLNGLFKHKKIKI